ncbi:hypothetical protein ACHMW7_16215 [Aminobacter sp. UC22_36]|uniref:hypothetical protein n=1 Tax=Aminobacter sp. UC22_36 TaxID=3374549 RepID=UPI003757E995
MNFLQLCQKVSSDSGTVDDSATLSTVVGVTRRNKKIVRWVNDAWRQIQNAHSTWRWMQAEFYGPTIAHQQRHAYSGFNDFATSAAITRFADWIYSTDDCDSGLSLYDPAIGVSDEGGLRFRQWDWFYKTQLRRHPERRKTNALHHRTGWEACFLLYPGCGLHDPWQVPERCPGTGGRRRYPGMPDTVP